MRRMERRIVLGDYRIGKICVLSITGAHIWKNMNERGVGGTHIKC